MLRAISKAVQIAVFSVATLAVLWGMVYRLILPFTPLWLDLASMGSALGGLVVLLALGGYHELKERRAAAPGKGKA
jgi:hypothetical protein